MFLIIFQYVPLKNKDTSLKYHYTTITSLKIILLNVLKNPVLSFLIVSNTLFHNWLESESKQGPHITFSYMSLFWMPLVHHFRSCHFRQCFTGQFHGACSQSHTSTTWHCLTLRTLSPRLMPFSLCSWGSLFTVQETACSSNPEVHVNALRAQFDQRGMWANKYVPLSPPWVFLRCISHGSADSPTEVISFLIHNLSLHPFLSVLLLVSLDSLSHINICTSRRTQAKTVSSVYFNL